MGKTEVRHAQDQFGVRFTVAAKLRKVGDEVSDNVYQVSLGISTCSPKDIYNRKKGEYAAIGRCDREKASISRMIEATEEEAIEFLQRELYSFINIAKHNAVKIAEVWNTIS